MKDKITNLNILEKILEKDFNFFKNFPYSIFLYKVHNIIMVIIFTVSFFFFVFGKENGDIFGALGIAIVETAIMFVILRVLLFILIKIPHLKPKIVKIITLILFIFILGLNFFHLMIIYVNTSHSYSHQNPYYMGVDFANEMLDSMGNSYYNKRAILNECRNANIYDSYKKRRFIDGCESVLGY